mgnify:CR=1 FL=1
MKKPPATSTAPLGSRVAVWEYRPVAMLATPVQVLKLNDLTVQLGGPIKKDKLFFHATFQRYAIDQYNPPVRSEVSPRVNLKLTYQITPNDNLIGRIAAVDAAVLIQGGADVAEVHAAADAHVPDLALEGAVPGVGREHAADLGDLAALPPRKMLRISKQNRITSLSDLPLGSKSEPPLPPPMGRVVNAFLKICSKPRNLRMPRLTLG